MPGVGEKDTDPYYADPYYGTYYAERGGRCRDDGSAAALAGDVVSVADESRVPLIQ